MKFSPLKAGDWVGVRHRSRDDASTKMIVVNVTATQFRARAEHQTAAQSLRFKREDGEQIGGSSVAHDINDPIFVQSLERYERLLKTREQERISEQSLLDSRFNLTHAAAGDKAALDTLLDIAREARDLEVSIQKTIDRLKPAQLRYDAHSLRTAIVESGRLFTLLAVLDLAAKFPTSFAEVLDKAIERTQADVLYGSDSDLDGLNSARKTFAYLTDVRLRFRYRKELQS